MHVLVTGANGFVGGALAARLRAEMDADRTAADNLTLLDVGPPKQAPGDGRIRTLQGSIADEAALAQAFDATVDVIFHLASIPGGMAEQDYELARDINLTGTQCLLEAARRQALAGGVPPVFVFASTIGVFAPPLPPVVDDTTPPNPGMTYGAQKLMGEILVGDFSRRGWVDGRSVRLPGVLARPPEPTGQASAFLSDIIREVAAGRSFVCPTSPQATTWASSVQNVVDNLLHAARVPVSRLGNRRTFTLPALRFSMVELVAAVGRVHDVPAEELVTWEPDPRREALFGRFPELATPAADRAGFRHDGDLATLVRCAL
ncbi:MAG: NAD-dependent epimerase/dehydratase family protein [Pigmentiphaga sp.]|uniref:NAD-dependent epimerase/dehydratase family protein n=1 Tax=Pigmentiphaga sp. TaxID=1977564 RepID=UPI003B573DD7